MRLPDDLYAQLQEIKHALDPEHYSAAPTIQDMVTVGVRRLVADWNHADQRTQLVDELLKQRQIARSRMGRRNTED